MKSLTVRVCWALLFCLAVVNDEGYGCCLGCPEEERIGLLNIKEAFNITNVNDDDNQQLSSWGGQEHQLDCCLWEYVSCDFHSKRVVQLLLNDTKKTGSDIVYDYYTVPKKGEGWYLNMSLFLPFQQLQNLSLNRNHLGGFTGEFESRKLQRLDLGGNLFQEIPPFLKRIKSLKHLNLEFNYLTNLSQFGDLTALSSLETLNLATNHINGEIPPFLGSLTNLKALSLTRNGLIGTLHQKGLCTLRNLEELDLSKNSLTGSIPPCLSNLTSLKLLSLFKNNLFGNIPSTLFSNLQSLEYLSLSFNHFQGLISFSSLSSNSKLEVFELDNHNSELEVDTENPPWTPLFQLKVLRLSNCKLNEPTHTIPTFLVHQHDLRVVNMSHNGMKGNIPTWLLTNNLNLQFLSLRNNLLTGQLILHTDFKNLQMLMLDISVNRVQEELPHFIGSVLPNLVYLNMSTNLFSGSIPPSLGVMVDLQLLDLSNNHFLGKIPERITMGCTSLRFLTISYNRLQGPLLPLRSNLTYLDSLDLSNNQFSGNLPRVLVNSTYLSRLDISNNSISGELPDWLGDLTGLTTLVLSANSFQGQIPRSFCKLNKLRFLDLSQNKFTDSIPSCANLTTLRYLHLQENNFTGLLPHVLSQSLSLVTLDVRDNQFCGEIPYWITSLSNLRVLLLKNNGFTGCISFGICQLTNISVLDLSVNKFVGIIPPCLSEIPFGSKTSLDDAFEVAVFTWFIGIMLKTHTYNSILRVLPSVETTFIVADLEEEIKFMTKSRYEDYQGIVLQIMSGIDLSGNQLVGSIPKAIGYISGIHTLNLSHNHLTSSIPTTFGNMKRIESLDLSHNNLSGSIPSELTQLNSLGVFSVAYNNLRGRTPEMKAQFSTFDSSSYEGNPLLCGPPLKKRCSESPPSSSSPRHDQEGSSSLVETFWWGFMISSVSGFTGVVSFIYYSSKYRYKVFKFVEDITGLPLVTGAL